LFTYNREKLNILNKIKNLYINYKKNNKIKNRVVKKLLVLQLEKKIKDYRLKTLKQLIYKNKNILNKKINNEKNLLLMTLKKKHINDIKILMLKQYLNIKNYSFEIEKLFFNYNKLLLLNDYKFKDFFLVYLKGLIKKFYNKDVEFKIINLKQLHLNSDIFLQSIALKLKNRNNNVLKVFNNVLNLVKLPILNKPCCNFIEKNYKNKNNKIHIVNRIFRYNNLSYLFNNITINVFNGLKHKYVIGVRLEAQGRLTKRLTASRSIFKFKSKGNIKNIDSSDKGISTVILKGNTKSNIQYTLVNSKTPNGSFGLRG
jgi:hypothetical protein